MNFAEVKPIADAVLYEGYILYPYRSNSAKNRQRWTFGGIYPQVYGEATDHAEPAVMRSECLVAGDADARLEVRLRFLQPMARQVGELEVPLTTWPAELPPSRDVATLAIDKRQFHSWQEAIERDIAVYDGCLRDLLRERCRCPFTFDEQISTEPLQDDDGVIRGLLTRRQASISGDVAVSLVPVGEQVWRLSLRITNSTDMDPSSVATRDEASLYSFASTHMMLGVDGADFISLTDPPESVQAHAAECRNEGAWPVLVGEPGSHDRVLCSPIILYDYPEVAPESPGDMFDGTEIDEILSLNILAMTDAEKRDMAATDPRAAALLERTEALGADDFMRLHGVLRKPRAMPGDMTANNSNGKRPLADAPSLVSYQGHDLHLQVGDRVRLRPKTGGDVMDLVLDGKNAVIEAIERDFEDRVHVAVAIDDDPGREWGLQRMPGHRFFFSPEEIEPLGDPGIDQARPGGHA